MSLERAPVDDLGLLGKHLGETPYVPTTLVSSHTGYSYIYRGTDTSLGREVAIKVLRAPAGSRPEDAAAQFAQEARMLAQLSCEHTVKIYGVDRVRVPAQGEMAFMAMEWIDGVTLRHYLKSKPHKSLGDLEVANVLVAVVKSLMEAHSKGFIHRDIKPDNIMITRASVPGEMPRVTVIDYGIGRAIEGASGSEQWKRHTRADLIKGTPDYMSPEQTLNKTLGPYTDIYALGLVAYEMLCGHQAHQWACLEDAFRFAMEPSDVELAVPKDKSALAGIIKKMLKADPAKRYPTCEVLLGDLRSLELKPLGTATPGASRPPVPPPPTKEAVEGERPRLGPSSRSPDTRAVGNTALAGRRLAAYALLACVGTLLVLFVVVPPTQRPDGPEAEPQSQAKRRLERAKQHTEASSKDTDPLKPATMPKAQQQEEEEDDEELLFLPPLGHQGGASPAGEADEVQAPLAQEKDMSPDAASAPEVELSPGLSSTEAPAKAPSPKGPNRGRRDTRVGQTKAKGKGGKGARAPLQAQGPEARPARAEPHAGEASSEEPAPRKSPRAQGERRGSRRPGVYGLE